MRLKITTEQENYKLSNCRALNRQIDETIKPEQSIKLNFLYPVMGPRQCSQNQD